ncbi:DUF3833 domain-containing protein [Paraglaciecola hydrolytica]|uniref:Lipoprotein n=1 Tax=Paraglaciecola hydrolytica TaxID=1799789 RepID=A0A136A403_9ALTE|nr:DUF3833 domain-containing protein [Paraglaciecola hydrolytica]KXI29936.1 hypothetical protein AX660_07920 [Paraglaciecola hydrolytica]
MRILLIGCFIFLAGCSSPHLDDYKTTTPALNLEQFFDGELTAQGMVLDYNGKMTRRFTVEIQANWQDNLGTLDEQFIYDDGERSERKWQIQRHADGTYSGTANDVIGTAKGASSGAAFYWRYQLTIEMDDGPIDVTLDDWMYLIDEHHLLNKSDIIKYGLKVGEVVLMIKKQP